MANLGITPPDFSTPLGKLRRDIGDTLFKATTAPGIGDYQYFSDDELDSYLADDNSHSRTVGYLYLTMAGIAAKTAELNKTYDLTNDNTKQPVELRAIAQLWFARADDEDAAAGLFDEFIITPTGRDEHCCTPEAAPFCRKCG